ncbi:L,D-transpeptidase family protein [Novosphingobium mangrovi (ex Huang et al. 2023)]|uniref:L,D-transpeptidase family protein n=1 Tax=Novosphingobium mangrovi (ex Huang et al. 2023) TaxID=2976432 RepID=A0ABT2IA21_9SPHN|nr:L,D-transpeptidase family protein [Novosphingobium mangrovi (ex Huang et al. 2023)]MCT2401646.1 L,D-transpeptidase family protein [Novosphingobium mangrovi (ex Huang et al. 2023)]
MRGWRSLAPLLMPFTLGAAVPVAPLALPEIDFVRVDKSDRTLALYAGGRLVHVIEHIQLGGQPVGAKRFEGDQRTPEGLYEIDWANPDSSYYLSLHISYPDAADVAYAEERGRSAGGMIMIHGQPNVLAVGRVPGDWTDGCIAVSDEEMDALWQSVPDGTPIEIVP